MLMTPNYTLPSTVAINKFNIDHLHAFIDEIWKYICTNMLKLNEDKTEFIILGTCQQQTTELKLQIRPSNQKNSVHKLSFHLDQQLNNNIHITNFCHSS